MNDYSRSLRAIVLCCSLSLGAMSATLAGTFKHIVIDGSYTDWAGVPIAYSDPSEEGAGAGTDFKTVWIAHDADYVYVRLAFYNTNSLLRSQNNVFLNTDGDSTTGYSTHGTGSEMLIQGGIGYQEKNGTFNDGMLIQDLGWAAAPAGAANGFEFRISRNAKYEDGGPVFTSDTLGILFETENSNFAEVDVAQDDGPVAYTLSPAPPLAHGTSGLVSLAGADWRFNRSGVDPGADWPSTTFDDTQAGWETGRALFGKTLTPGAYPTPIATPFSDNQSVYYFRTKFTWDKDSAGLSLIASNYVSDGALIYLNGVEVGRLRLPSGPIQPSTAATGANPNAGQSEILDLPANALVVGDNVLAVEVHQSAGDTTDLVFGLSLTISDQVPAAVVTPAAPVTLSVDEGAEATFTATARGTEPITYQWFKGTTPISNATNATYTITSTTATDAGKYVVKVSNLAAQNVASPEFTLQTRAVAATITDPKLPADATVTAGAAASFTVSVAGSKPFAFQWFKDGIALAGATNQNYDIPVVLATDAGQYAVVVSNRITAPLTSRTATLTVNSDTIPPTLVTVAGGGRHLAVQFSEAIDPASLVVGNFTLTPAVAISGVKTNGTNSASALLDTAALQLGTLYSLAVKGVKDRFGNAINAGASKSFRATILIDGDFSDWEGVALAYSDPEDAGPDTGTHADFKDVWVTSDNDYIYLRFTLWRTGDPFIFYNNIFVDADNDATTGYVFNGLGSDLLIQGGAGYEQKVGVFNDGGVNNLDWLAAPEPPGTEFEVRFSRKAEYADPDAGGLVFKGATIAFVLESENNGFVAKDTAPDSDAGPIVHTLNNYAVTELGALSAARAVGGVRITWSGAGKLQSTASLSPASWQDVPNASSPFAANSSDRQTFYRLAPK